LDKDVDALLRDLGRYRKLIRKLICLTITHPEVTIVVGVASSFMENPHQGK